jgi:hypothetical protein
MEGEMTIALENEAIHIEETVLNAIRGIRYGAVEIVIHDSRIVQIQRTEKLRVDTNRS